jgi:hypothetical protein
MTQEELEVCFKVCHILMLNKDNEQSNIKMYADNEGTFTGGADGVLQGGEHGSRYLDAG